MRALHVWSANLTIRRKFQILGLGLILPFVLALWLATTIYSSVTAEVSQTLALGARGDVAIGRGAQINTLLLIQTTLQTLSLQASDPPGEFPDDTVFSEASRRFAEADDAWVLIDSADITELRRTWDEIRTEFLVRLPEILNERLKVRQSFTESFQKLEGLTDHYQEQLGALASGGILLAQTRAFFAVLTVLQGRDAPYLNERALTDWRRQRDGWRALFPSSGPYRELALEYLKVIDAELVPTMEGWISERQRTELSLLRYNHDQTARFQQVATRLTAESQRQLDLVGLGLSERSRSQSDLQSQSLFWLLTLLSTGVLGGLLLFFLLRIFERGLITPLTQATEWAARIRAGDYEARLALSRGDEIGVLSAALEHMAHEVIRKTRETEEVNRNLEETVSQRTLHLAQALHRLEEAQSKLVLSEKLAVLGTLAASMAHELNTPLAAILSADRTILDYLGADLGRGLEFYTGLGGKEREAFVGWVGRSVPLASEFQPRHSRSVYREVRDRLEAQGAKAPQDQAELWIELGLGADADLQTTWAAHPQILELLRLALDVTNLHRMAYVIETATNQASRVVQSLQRYIRNGTPDGSAWFGLREQLATCLELVGRQRLKDVEIRWDFDPTLQVFGAMEDLTQVWINLITNAAQAMSFRGSLTFEAEVRPDVWLVGVRDTGPGVPPEIGDRIFEPFYTTKDTQGGMGLGLDICRRQMETLGGTLTFRSVPGDTVFVLSWPRPAGPDSDRPVNPS